jgi:hypothetical protein
MNWKAAAYAICNRQDQAAPGSRLFHLRLLVMIQWVAQEMQGS